MKMDSSSLLGAPPAARRGHMRLYAAVALLFGALYALTAQHGPAWQYAGMFQLRAVDFDLKGWLDLARSHPLLIAIGGLFQYLPAGDLAWRINMMSAVCGALAVANVALLVRRLAPETPAAAWVAAPAFGLAHTTWWLSTVYQTHALHVMLLTLQLNVVVSLVRGLRPYQAGLLGLVAGLSFSAHNQAFLMAPACVALTAYLCSRKHLPWRAMGLLVGGWLVGSSLMLCLIWQECAANGLAAAIHSTIINSEWEHVVGFKLKPTIFGAGYVVYNFPNLMLVIAVVGIGRLTRSVAPAVRWTICYAGLAYLVYAIWFSIPTQFMFFLPLYAVVAVLAGLGFARLAERRGKRRWLIRLAVVSLAVGPVLYGVAPIACRAAGVTVPVRSDLRFRDPAGYLLTPWKVGDRSALQFARAALTEAQDGDTIICDDTTMWPLLWVRRFERVGKGVRVLYISDARPGSTPAGHPRIFSASGLSRYVPPWILRLAVVEETGPDAILFHIRWESPETGIPPMTDLPVDRRPVEPASPLSSQEELVLDLGDGVTMKLALIPAGSFWRGSANSQEGRSWNEGPRRRKTISTSFYLGIYEVTRGQFARFVAETGYVTDAEKAGTSWSGLDADTLWWMPGPTWRQTGFPQTDDHPVVHVSWNDATAFCRWLSETTGRLVHLPGETEWEYACRAGTQTAFFWGDDPDDGEGFCNAADLTAREQYPNWPAFNFADGYVSTSPVGTFKPNAFGLYDMAGNVWDWCADQWAHSLAGTGGVDPPVPGFEAFRVLRGGGWDDANEFCRSAERRRGPQYYRSWSIGFRVAVD